MALRINTNVAALNAHKNMIKTDNKLSESLGRLSSGLRINKAADDAAGMAIADSLRSQALGLGQAIKNGADGISIVQTADAALEESINIVNTIKQKAIQAAQDGQTVDSRKAIQADISKLIEELDAIAKTTAFNNQKLLSGNFTNKKFQMGAYAGETVDVSIASAEATKIGHITTSNLAFAGEGTAELNIYSSLHNQSYSLNSIGLAYNNDRENSIGAVADAINKLSDVLGISATANVTSTTDDNITAGVTDDSFAINGITIGALNVAENDSDGALVVSINSKTSQHGVFASVDEEGVLTLTSTDDRAIEVIIDDATRAVLGGTENMTTFGIVELRQEGTAEIVITDTNAQAGIAFSVKDGLTKMGAVGVTTQSMELASGSLIAAGSVYASGAVIQGSFTLVAAAVAGAGNDDNVIGAGSVIQSGSIIGSGTTLQGDFRIQETNAMSDDSIIASGSLIKAGSTGTINSGSVFVGDVSASLSGASAGDVIVSGGYTYIAVGGEADVISDFTTAGITELATGSILVSGSIVTAGTTLYDDIVLDAGITTTTTASMDVNGGATSLAAGTILMTGSMMGTDALSGSGAVFGGSITLAAGSQIGAGSSFANGSSIGVGSVALSDDEKVSMDKDMLLAVGSILAAGSILSAGTVLTNDIIDENGTEFKEGMTLQYDIVTGTNVAFTKDMVINGESMLAAGTTLGVNGVGADDTVDSSTSDGISYRLSDVDVSSQEGAQIAIAVADAALKNLDKVRSDLGSVQNQLTATISNISTTRINVVSAESTIRDVDFAGESAIFTKMEILLQAGTFSMAKANVNAQNVLSLLQ